MENRIRESIINQPSYWVEAVNGYLYQAIVSYMEDNDLNRTQIAEHLNISKGRVSQMLNDGDTNFSIKKLIEIALKVDKFPVIEFINKQLYLQKEFHTQKHETIIIEFNSDEFSESISEPEAKTEKKPLSLKSYNTKELQHNYN